MKAPPRYLTGQPTAAHQHWIAQPNWQRIAEESEPECFDCQGWGGPDCDCPEDPGAGLLWAADKFNRRHRPLPCWGCGAEIPGRAHIIRVSSGGIDVIQVRHYHNVCAAAILADVPLLAFPLGGKAGCPSCGRANDLGDLAIMSAHGPRQHWHWGCAIAVLLAQPRPSAWAWG